MKQIKFLNSCLHLCAVTALKMKGEFAAYYQRKIAEGKQPLKVINAIRNKLALRIAAVIRNENYIANNIFNNLNSEKL